MIKKCLNCNSEISGQYCSNCGQNSDTHKINLPFLWHDVQHGLLHIDKGILFTTKELFTRPGHSIREFLQGKRVRHFKPISFVIIFAGIYSLLSHFFGLNFLANYYEFKGSGQSFSQLVEAVGKTTEWLSNHYSIVSLIQIPIFSFGTYIFFKKADYNYIEHLVINSFITGQKLILHILTFPIYYCLRNSTFSKPTDQIIGIIGFLLACWTLYQLFNEFTKFQRIWRTVFSLLIPVTIFILVSLIIILILIKEIT